MGGSKKITLEEIKNRLKNINPNIEILSDKYSHSKAGLKCKCLVDKCNHEWTVSWGNLSQGRGCPKCGGHIKLTIEDIKHRLYSINKNIEILDECYINNKSKITCRCLVDKHEWLTTWGNLSQGQGCPMCYGKIKLTLGEVKERLAVINPNIEILSSEYISIHKKLNCKCLIDYFEWRATWGNLSRGQGCPMCAGNAKLTLKEVRHKTEAINSNIIILSDEYISAHHKLECKCIMSGCGHKWKTTWGSLQNGHGCPKCNKGWYSIKRANRHKEVWENIESFLYIIKCNGNGEEFYKIGITQRGVKIRFKTKRFMPYNYDVILEIKTNKYKTICLESEIHDLNYEFSYTPKIKFDGYTECFSQLNEKTFELLVDTCVVE